MTIIIKEVLKEDELHDFIRFPERLYKNEPGYFPPIRSEEVKTFDHNTNLAFDYCDARLWLAIRNKKVVGRVAGIINHRYNDNREVKYARFGWLDFIEEQEVLEKLLHTVEVWAMENDLYVVHGPLGFTSFDPSGVLIEGFGETLTSYARFNYPYYGKLIDACGYKKEIDWVEYDIAMPDEIPERIVRGAELVKNRYHLRHVKIKNRRDLVNYAGEIFKLINRSYSGLYGFSEISKEQTKRIIKANWLLLKRAYTSLIVDEQNKLVGFGLAFPSLSDALKKINGAITLRGYFSLYKSLKHHQTADLLLIAVRNDYKRKGVNAMIFHEIGQKFLENGIKHIETTKELEKNRDINQLWNKLEARQHKRTRCYRKNLT